MWAEPGREALGGPFCGPGSRRPAFLRVPPGQGVGAPPCLRPSSSVSGKDPCLDVGPPSPRMPCLGPLTCVTSAKTRWARRWPAPLGTIPTRTGTRRASGGGQVSPGLRRGERPPRVPLAPASFQRCVCPLHPVRAANSTCPAGLDGSGEAPLAVGSGHLPPASLPHPSCSGSGLAAGTPVCAFPRTQSQGCCKIRP